jgi:hypothetical protein
MSTVKNSEVLDSTFFGTIGKYFVLYFDVQGVRDQIFGGVDWKTEEIPLKKQQEITIFSAALRDMFVAFAQIVYFLNEKPSEYLEYLTRFTTLSQGEKDSLLEDVKKVHVGAQQFSDSTLIYVRDTGTVSRIVFEQCMVRCSYELVKAMGRGVYVRGAMSYGYGWELMPNCLFGPIIQEVYEIEQKVANTFRIVVTPAFYAEARRDLGMLEANGCDMSKSYPFKMIARDPDGILMFDYLSDVALDNMQRFDDFALKIVGESLEKAYNRIAQKHKDLLAKVDEAPKQSRLVMKYAMYMSYLEARFNNFQVYGARFVKEAKNI